MGRLINFEAIDRAGKTSDARAVAEALRERGKTVTAFVFPDRPPRDVEPTVDLPAAQYATGVLINRYLDGSLPLVDLRSSFFRRSELIDLPEEVRESIAGDVQEMLFQALCSINRRERHWMLRKALNEHDFVFVNRWYSGYAYGIANGVSRIQIDSMESDLPVADLTFLLDIDPDARTRRDEDGLVDLYEGNAELQRRVRRIYLDMLRDEERRADTERRASRIVRMDAGLPEGTNVPAMVKAILSL